MEYGKSYGELLKERGYRRVHVGTRMLEYAAEFTANQGLTVSMTRDVYPALEKAFAAGSPERNMRYAAKAAGDPRTVAEIIWDLVDEGYEG